MHFYLPIAEMSVHVLVFLCMGAAVGFLSGVFGVGGGFLMTPLLIFTGVPSVVAVGTEAAQIVATSVSGALAQWRRNAIDVKLGIVLLIGGVMGAVVGVQAVRILRRLGHFDVFVTATYVTFLGIVGSLMLIESINTWRKVAAGQPVGVNKPGTHTWLQRLPLRMRFPRSKLSMSAIPPFLIGGFVGLLAAIMGVGGGFIMVPALIYLLRVPTAVVAGTSLFQIVFVTAATTLLHATVNRSVDFVLAALLIAGGVVGAQFGAAWGARLRAEQFRFFLAAIVLIVCLRMAYSLAATPGDLYTLSDIRG